jgi:hypothetical protein
MHSIVYIRMLMIDAHLTAARSATSSASAPIEMKTIDYSIMFTKWPGEVRPPPGPRN